jgi:multidrug efflux pump subunit AcrA (membrane-fusion protein)
MNKLKIASIFIFTIVFLSSCRQNESEEQNVIAKAQVTVSKMSEGYLPDYIRLTGKTIYLNKSTLVAPISGYITKVNVRQGDKVRKGDLLFEMQTPEIYTLAQKDSNFINYGLIKIYAPVSGSLINLNIVDKSVFADKGTLICVLIASNDLKLQVNIPFAYNQFAKIGNTCKIILPDDKEIQGTFTKILPQIDEQTQTLKVLANINTGKFIPENMIVSVLLDKSIKHKAQILPKKCLQTDALMKKYWLMKIINDSVAVQTFVKVANQTQDSVEILSPQFADSDLFVSDGAYGLSDTVLIQINN